MVCWRFSLPSCRENMNARRACPFLGPEAQRLVTHGPAPPVPRGEHRHTNPAIPALQPHHPKRWKAASLQKMADAACSSSYLRAFSGFPYLHGATQRGALGQGRSLSLEPSTLCHHLICHKSVKSMKLGVLSKSQMPTLSKSSTLCFLDGWTDSWTMDRWSRAGTGPGTQASPQVNLHWGKTGPKDKAFQRERRKARSCIAIARDQKHLEF